MNENRLVVHSNEKPSKHNTLRCRENVSDPRWQSSIAVDRLCYLHCITTSSLLLRCTVVTSRLMHVCRLYHVAYYAAYHSATSHVLLYYSATSSSAAGPPPLQGDTTQQMQIRMHCRAVCLLALDRVRVAIQKVYRTAFTFELNSFSTSTRTRRVRLQGWNLVCFKTVLDLEGS